MKDSLGISQYKGHCVNHLSTTWYPEVSKMFYVYFIAQLFEESILNLILQMWKLSLKNQDIQNTMR